MFPIDALARRPHRVREGASTDARNGAMRYGIVESSGSSLHDIWGMGNTTIEALLSLGVVALFTVAFGAVAIRAFTRSAVR
jgi:hypothetical protein